MAKGLSPKFSVKVRHFSEVNKLAQGVSAEEERKRASEPERAAFRSPLLE
jgi:hypothetical protein